MLCEPVNKRIRIDTNVPDNCQTASESSIDSLKEAEVGITSFLNKSSSGFHCILKNRWEDFIVREVANGIPAVLSTVKYDNAETDSEPVDFGNILHPYLEQLHSLSNGESETYQIKASDDKDTRALVHKAIRAKFPNLISTTVKCEESSVILVSKSGRKQTYMNAVIPKRAVARLPNGLPYCRFVLYKEGKDTISAVQLLARFLHVNHNHFGYAGTKDKRAITTQFVTVKGVDSKRLVALNQTLKGIRVGNFSYVPSPIFLGDLEENQFTIVLRSVSVSESEMQDLITPWETRGFVNYYGLQRFGHSALSKSFDIGRHLILGKWTEAIDLILKPTPADLPVVRIAKEKFRSTGNASDCAAEMPVCAEKCLLLGIAKHGKSLNALQSLPRHLLRLYVHSYQSLVWNRVASRRIDELGINDFHAQPGDLYVNAESCTDLCRPDELVEAYPTVEDGCDEDVASKEMPLSKEPLVVTESDCRNIPLTQVVLPLPGYAVRYPENASGTWYSDYLTQDGLTVQSLKHRVKDISLPGSYRALVVKPRGVSVQTQMYTDPTVSVLKTDRQKLENIETVQPVISDISSEAPDSQRAVILTMTLPKSSYATMAIRELTKAKVVEQR